MTDAKTEVTLWLIEDLIPYANNPKEHPDEQVQKIASSIKNYGWDQPIVVDGDGEIIKGHGRMQAAELLDLDEVPVIKRPELTDAEAKAARIADNKTAESSWDDELLSIELDDLQDDFEEIALGYDEGEIDNLLTEVEDSTFLDDDMSDGESDSGNDSAFDARSINASTYVELSFSLTPPDREHVNSVLNSTGLEQRKDQLLAVINAYDQ